jgi:hypothetical protein
MCPNVISPSRSLIMKQDKSDSAGPIFSRSLRREVLFLVLVKLALLFLIYRLFFAPYETPSLSQDVITHHLLGP